VRETNTFLPAARGICKEGTKKKRGRTRFSHPPVNGLGNNLKGREGGDGRSPPSFEGGKRELRVRPESTQRKYSEGKRKGPEITS